MTAHRLTASGFPILLLLLTACCSHLAAPVPMTPEVPCSPFLLLRQAGEVPAVHSLKGIARIKVESPDETFSVKEFIIAQRPGSLRLETLTPLGQPGFYAATDGRELFLYNPSENTHYHGEATPRNLRLIKIPLHLAIEEVVSLVLGGVVLIDYDPEQSLCSANGDDYRIRLMTGDKKTTQVLTLSREDLRVVASETFRDGEALTLSVTYGSYEVDGGVNFPREIAVTFPADRTTVRINYKKVEFLSEVDSSLFRLDAPQGATTVPLE